MNKLIICMGICCSLMLCTHSFAAEETMKISYGGEVKAAKDIASGKGISFSLPQLDNDSFYINAVEMAVFEKEDGGNSWHMYKDENGEECKKKYIAAPASLNINAGFGNVSDYRDKAKYKLAYRYLASSKDDQSQNMIAGENIKDGWRLVGETNSAEASDNGLSFYKNSLPTMTVQCFSYHYYSRDGVMTADCCPSELGNTYFPADVFVRGITVQMYANDFDREDILTVDYHLEDAENGKVIYEGPLPADNTIKTEYQCKKYKLQLTVSDNFGGSITSDEYIFQLDTELPQVVSAFDDGGYALKGATLFSDFKVEDDSSIPMTNGSVYAKIYRNGTEIGSAWLENIGKGIFRLDKSGMQDGKYKVLLNMFDKAGNMNEYVFEQTLDNTAPSLYFFTPEENTQATYYSKWMNESKKVIFKAEDEYAGVKKYTAYLASGIASTGGYTQSRKNVQINFDVTGSKTGKLRYRIYVYDDAKSINKTQNRYNASSQGNRIYVEKYVWLDKTDPSVTINHSDVSWKAAPYTVEADFYDYPSSSAVNDASGIMSKQYAITNDEFETPVYKAYDGGVTFTDGGVYYLHFKAKDNAGNEKSASVKVRINSPSRITGRVRPTEDSKHTIYYGTSGFYVAKNTAYSTKYHFEIEDNDVNDIIKASVKLVSQDDSSVYAMAESENVPDGNTQRDITFSMAYLDDELAELPDGVYDMFITVSEVKNDGEEVITHENIKDCEVVIKRNSPPTPIISVNAGKVKIEYPNEPLSGSLNSEVIQSHYKYQYKALKDGDASTNSYKTYTGEFDADDFIVTALYTDIAGNTSVATMRIYKDESGGGSDDDDIITDGDTITVEESRAADVYYIGVRRNKNHGINNDVFDFLN